MQLPSWPSCSLCPPRTPHPSTPGPCASNPIGALTPNKRKYRPHYKVLTLAVFEPLRILLDSARPLSIHRRWARRFGICGEGSRRHKNSHTCVRCYIGCAWCSECQNLRTYSAVTSLLYSCISSNEWLVIFFFFLLENAWTKCPNQGGLEADLVLQRIVSRMRVCSPSSTENIYLRRGIPTACSSAARCSLPPLQYQWTSMSSGDVALYVVQ